MPYTIRRARPGDKDQWAGLRHGLWPEAPLDYLYLDLDRWLSNPDGVVLVASDSAGRLVGFIEADLRSHAEGCETSPVGYIEAWYVDPHVRGQKLGRELVQQAEQWAREKGCTEMASDTWLENDGSIAAHYKLGYWETDRLVHFVKRL